MTMDAKVDYLSYTVLHELPATPEREIPESGVHRWLEAQKPHMWDLLDRFGGWREVGARGHYSQSIMAENYARISWGWQCNHVLIELPGTACQDARDAGLLLEAMGEALERATRLDIACDVPEGASPREFVAAGYSDRFGAYAEMVSQSGETEYVGSLKSDRYARVYMYAEPHPRAGVLRIEHVLRRGFAKSAIKELIGADGLAQLVCMLGNSFGWQHRDWTPGDCTDGKLKATRADRHAPGRVRWLYDVVMPALVKADAEGLIQFQDFFERADTLRRSHGV